MEDQGLQFSGFWRRIGAFVIDLLVLGLAGAILVYPFFDQASRLGAWGRLIGFIVAGIYFSLLNGPIGKGQTFGKRLVGIRVVNSDGTSLSMAKALGRYLPLGLPYFLNNLPLDTGALLSYWIYVLSMLVFGIGLSTVYLFIFNSPSRQVMHDLLVRSYVIRETAAGAGIPPTKRRHYAVCSAILAASMVIPYFTTGLAYSGTFSGLLEVQKAIESVSWVQHVGVTQGKSTSGSNSKTYLSVAVTVNDGRTGEETRAVEIAQRAMRANPEANTLDVIHVVMTYGFDIGIASGHQTHTFAHSPEEWSSKSPKSPI